MPQGRMNPRRRRELMRSLEKPTKVDALDTVVTQLLQCHAVTAETTNTLHQCLQELEEAMVPLGVAWRVGPFGSCANGFSTRFSDLDTTCYVDGGEEHSYKALKPALCPLLKAHRRFHIVEELWHTRVPIVRLRFDDELDFDLSCCNAEVLRNTNLLLRYSKLNELVPKFVVSVKLWAKAEGLIGAPRGCLSSYSFVLMALYFLQVDVRPRLPCLPPEDGSATTVWVTKLPLAHLLRRFFLFYANSFRWGFEVVAVRLGQLLLASHSTFQQLPRREQPRLHIEDPFLQGRNLNCVLGAEQEQELCFRMVKAVQDLADGGVPASLRDGLSDPRSEGLLDEGAGFQFEQSARVPLDVSKAPCALEATEATISYVSEAPSIPEFMVAPVALKPPLASG